MHYFIDLPAQALFGLIGQAYSIKVNTKDKRDEAIVDYRIY